MEARNIRCRMGLLDGVTGKWETGPVSISTLNLELRAGTDDAESAKALAEALFRQSGKVLVHTLEVGDTALRWGYSERTRGAIEGSAMTVNRIGAGWRFTFKGGTFSQNWLRNLEIVNLVVVADPDGLTFEKAEFRRGLGTVDASGLKLAGGELPTLSGTVKIRMLGLDSILPAALKNFLEGTISGDFKISGSTNSSEGIGFDGLVTLDGRDTLVLRERLPLLEALSVVDYVRNYYRVDFREGSFRLKTGNGGAKISDLKLKAQDILTLEGNLLVRMPNAEETQEDSRKVPDAANILNRRACSKPGGGRHILAGRQRQDCRKQQGRRSSRIAVVQPSGIEHGGTPSGTTGGRAFLPGPPLRGIVRHHPAAGRVRARAQADGEISCGRPDGKNSHGRPGGRDALPAHRSAGQGNLPAADPLRGCLKIALAGTFFRKVRRGRWG